MGGLFGVVVVIRSGTIEDAPNFRYEEFFASDTADSLGLSNVAYDVSVYEAIRYLATEVLQPVRDHFQVPIYVTSGYRTPVLNAAVGGAASSHHLTGCAADIRFNRSEKRYTIKDLFSWVYRNVPYTELIAEGIPSGWVHIALVRGRESEKALKYMLNTTGVVYWGSYNVIMHYYKQYYG